MSDLKIIGLQIDGFKKLKAVEMEFSPGGCTFIRGKNEQGKTSIIESLWWLFKGKSVINDGTIQTGKDKITGSVDLGSYVVSRVQTEKSARLEIRNKEGLEVTKDKQGFLDSLINELTFNPFPFLNLPPEKQLKFMMDFLDIDFGEIDVEIKKNEDERLYAGRKIKEIGAVENIPEVKPVEIGDLNAKKNSIQKEIDGELEAIRKHNELQAERTRELDGIYKQIENLENGKTDIEKELSNLEFALNRKRESLEKFKKLITSDIAKGEAVRKSIEPTRAEVATQTTADVDKEIEDAAEINKKAHAYQQNEEKRKQLNAVKLKKEEHQNKIDELREAKKQKLSATETGVAGLTITETELLYEGIPVENCSSSQRRKMSMELCAAMKPPLKAVFLDQGETFDDSRIAEIEKFAKENSIQVVITQVANKVPKEIPDGVFYIVDGEIN